jgi:hypothetical protein
MFDCLEQSIKSDLGIKVERDRSSITGIKFLTFLEMSVRGEGGLL